MIALVGASNDESKYGNRIARHLIETGQEFVPINLNEPEVVGKQAYATLRDAAEEGVDIDEVVFVVPPSATLTVLTQMNDLDLRRAWFQPGSADERCWEYCQAHDIEAVSGCKLQS